MKKLFCIFALLLVAISMQAQPNTCIESTLQYNWATEQNVQENIVITTTDTTLLIENTITGATYRFEEVVW